MKQEESFTKQRNKIIKRVVLSRIYIVMFLLVVKVFFGIWLWRQMKEYFFYSYGLNTLLTFLVYIVIVNRKGNPSYKLTWMLPILLLPIFGILLYLFFEYQRFPALLNKMQETQQKEMGIYMKQEYDVLEEIRTVSPESANLSVYLYQSMRLPAYRNTRITYYPLNCFPSSRQSKK
ncbi:PLD nuclease N-terminal domain-containing protein [Mediterraneibacter gnavus]|uniref:PLD nuclease N-terminal domain-containing protein n=1 Tax=Mediterraneibacter gnavus TaxID=33038 RepID=UPI003568A7BE